MLTAALLTLLPLLAAAPTPSADALNPYPDGRRLTFTNGSFKLAHFTDLHYGERGANNGWSAWGDERGRNSTRVMNDCLDDEKPNFIVFGGDQTNGENALKSNATAYLDWAFSPALRTQTPFATTYGNHDHSVYITHSASYDFEKNKAQAKALSWTQRNLDSSVDPEGSFNYYIPVYADAAATVPSLLLWFLDSRSGVFTAATNPEDWVDTKAASWINSTAASMKAAWGKLPKSLVYVHIPPTAALTIQTKDVNPNPSAYPGINGEVVTNQGKRAAAFNVKNPELVFWNAVTATLGGVDGQGLIALTSGHDHYNDWCGRDTGIGPFTFCYGRHTGYGGYSDLPRGARLFQASLDARSEVDSLKSWIWLENHSTQNTNTLVQQGKTTLLNSHDPKPNKL
ncbi:putative inactive purple acid phosphatase 16 [Vanrija pseudolonga]|uniref:Inactive purple acid phosphatase 16 n=1 Tax=Vanrija pseudolonga TaxID=143232 RepID=A0AAF0Y8P3_9TREE|nr:putative inactive purple acid phosphatase 16 [Vanrija pseudolonga]